MFNHTFATYVSLNFDLLEARFHDRVYFFVVLRVENFISYYISVQRKNIYVQTFDILKMYGMLQRSVEEARHGPYSIGNNERKQY